MIARSRIVLIRPREEFESFKRVWRSLLGECIADFEPRYFDVPLLAILVDAGGTPVWIPTLYLAHCALRGRSATGDTVRTYAEALQVWMLHMERSNWSFDEVTEDDFAAFRNQLVHRARATNGRRYATSTANHRISVVCNFYLWGEKCGLISSKFGQYLEARERSRRGFSRLRNRQFECPTKSLAPAVVQRLPRLLSREELHLLFREARGTYKLAFKWALVTGLRRFEICNLTVGQLPSPESLAMSRDRLFPINILRKGSRDITAYVPISLIEETRWYILTERKTPKSEDERRIFVGVRGDPISKNALSKEFRRCANKIGSDATLHHLRHTFAINVLETLERRAQSGDPLNSMKTLQILLGHASLESTEIYLRAMDVSNESVMQALDHLYGATL
ncbi:tyrosine-type recombinase/integrase [Paraburkholderia fungorum]|uniref:tyrosine-type recombinase/integrase n=1 Tax=Paraburkholderia fungorum TaxID=134537 RepID=UPI0038BD7135